MQIDQVEIKHLDYIIKGYNKNSKENSNYIYSILDS